MRKHLLVSLVAIGVVAALLVADADAQTPGADRPNVLLLIADDLGIDADPCAVPQVVPAPRLANFCKEAVVFDNVWTNPICSPTRAGILTGRHSFRTGIGEQVSRQNGLVLDESEVTLPEVVASAGYATANFGKWHLGGGPTRPNDMGWDHFAGLLVGGLRDYSNWNKVTNGEESNSTTYTTTDQVNDTIAWIDDQSEPWLAWVAFNAPHTPYHLPPADLHTQELSGTAADIEANPVDYFHAAIEALDTEIGRLIDSIEPDVLDNTTIIFLGDNGTSAQVSPYRRNAAKGSLSEGGVHVPMMIWGAGVEGGRHTDALVGSVDLFATIADLAGAALPTDRPLDSASFVHLLASDGTHHQYVLSEVFGEITRDEREGATIRDQQYKLIAYADGSTEFFDLAADRTAQSPVSAASRSDGEQERFDELTDVLRTWTASETAERPSSTLEMPSTTSWSTGLWDIVKRLAAGA